MATGTQRASVSALLLAIATSGLAACLPDNPALIVDTGDDTSDDTATPPVTGAGSLLGCGGDPCTLLLVSQTLDDRIEVFSPDAPDGALYRGAIELDLKPNTCAGCGLGDYGEGRLDEPYGLAIAGGFLHVVAGHYPSSAAGSLISFPLALFEPLSAGDRVAVDSYFAGGVFGNDVVATPLGELEPIFVTPVEDKLVLGVFNNNLFSTEDAWTVPGRLLIIDPTDPAAPPGVVSLSDLDGGACNGAGEVVELTTGALAVTCDGNEAVGVLDVPAFAGMSPADAAAGISGRLCNIPASTSNRRVRTVAPDASGGFVVADGPTATDPFGPGRVWHFDGDCTMQSFVTLPDDADWQLGQLARWPVAADTWLLATGSISGPQSRGVVVVQDGSDGLQVCGPIGGMEDLLTEGGDSIEPFALAVTTDGGHAAIGAGPLVPATAGPGFGKVLWASLDIGDDPCTTTADVIDLTSGAPGAPAVEPADPATFRRAPHVIEIVEVTG